MKKVGIMQPYFLPYLGYFQLMNYVDEFIVYDNIEFIKRGWIHRNRFLKDDTASYFTIPLKKDSDFLNVNERVLADSFTREKNKILNKVKNNYQSAPEFSFFFPVIEKIFNDESRNLFDFIFNSIMEIKNYLSIDTQVLVSSKLPIDHNLKSQNKVIALVKACRGTEYVNFYGGKSLYQKSIFQKENILLSFMKMKPIEYEQKSNNFIPNLSILDVLMFNDKEAISSLLKEYNLE